jgi:hypothetical protein
MSPASFISNHPYQAMIYAVLFTNLVNAMPTPNGIGIRGTTAYRWLFGFLHSLPNIPRLLVTLFPAAAGAVGILTPSETAAKVAEVQRDTAKT